MMWRLASNRKDNRAASELHPLYPLACSNVIIAVLWGSQHLCVHLVHVVQLAAPLKDMLGWVIFFPISEKVAHDFPLRCLVCFPCTLCVSVCVSLHTFSWAPARECGVGYVGQRTKGSSFLPLCELGEQVLELTGKWLMPLGAEPSRQPLLSIFKRTQLLNIWD